MKNFINNIITFSLRNKFFILFLTLLVVIFGVYCFEKNVNGTPILVKNLATVKESSLPRLGQCGIGDKNDVVEGMVLMHRGDDPGAVIPLLKKKVADIQAQLPKDVKIVPFYDRTDLINVSVHTVLHNLAEGLILVTIIVFLFMADWRTTINVAIVVPLSLLFAFICLYIKGMSANLISMGAIDFGIIIDGAVVMVEGLFVALDAHARKVGMQEYNKQLKLGLIRRVANDRARAVFFSKLIIITALIPIFSFQKVEGKMFSPMLYARLRSARRTALHADPRANANVGAAEKERKREAQSVHCGSY